MISMLGWLGSALVVASLVQHDVRRLRQVNLAACVALAIFNMALGIVSMIALNIVLAGVNGYHLLRTGADARHGTQHLPDDVASGRSGRHPSRNVRCEANRPAIEQHKVLVARHPTGPM